MSFTGTLAELALCDLVEITTLGAKSGVLEVAHPNGAPAGRLSFRDGALVGAECGPLVGERAFYALLGLKEGGFVFDPELDPGKAAADLPTGSLLMEAMRRVDESGHLRAALPACARVAFRGGRAQRRRRSHGPGSTRARRAGSRRHRRRGARRRHRRRIRRVAGARASA